MARGLFDEHFQSVSPEIRSRLTKIVAEVERRVPDAEPCIGYHMPAFRLGRIFFYFAAFKKHIGIYPPVTGPEELLAKLAPYRGPKGNLAFPHDEPLPVALIGAVAEQLVCQYGKMRA